MANKLVIVESPAKAKTIRKYLGAGYDVQASMGHVRDLPKSGLGVDVDGSFEAEYVVTKDKAAVVKDLRQRVKGASEVFLATDPDREGEAIAWHIYEVTSPRGKPVHRVTFHEVTAPAIQDAFAHPRQIDMQLVDAQQARRILDRLVGYRISPLLWEKVKYGLSAGRVQSVAVRLVVDREREIQNFKPEEYWTVEADLSKVLPKGQKRTPKDVFRAVLYSVNGKKLGKFGLRNEADARAIVDALEGANYWVLKLTQKTVRRNPVPPFITSTLQQAASRALGFAPSRTMRVAQQLYEGVELGNEGSVGLITYMRTDSTAVSPLAQQEAREYIAKTFGPEYLPERPPVYKTRSASAQEAHEAIRPTATPREPQAIKEYLSSDQFRLYDLIWKRFVASQMAAAVFEQTTADVGAAPPSPAPPLREGEGRGEGQPPYVFRATGSVLIFPGFLKVYGRDVDEEAEEGEEGGEKYLPPLKEGEPLDLVQLLALQHFTEPPPRYTEATLIKELEKRGIGRPSTYAPIVSTIQEREYVETMEARKRNSPLRPTDLGFLVNDLLVAHFPDILNYDFTSQMESRLDEIAEGRLKRVPVLQEFNQTLSAELEKARVEMRDVKSETQATDLVCEKCGQPMVIRWGRNGEFLACSGYPECKNTSNFTRTPEGKIVPAREPTLTTEEVCEKCGKPMVVKRGRFGPFLACSGYPDCKNTRPLVRNAQGELVAAPKEEATGEVCEKCGKPMVMKRGRYGPFLGCSGYPECRNIRKLPGDQGKPTRRGSRSRKKVSSKGQGARDKGQGTRSKGQGTRSKGQGTRSKAPVAGGQAEKKSGGRKKSTGTKKKAEG